MPKACDDCQLRTACFGMNGDKGAIPLLQEQAEDHEGRIRDMEKLWWRTAGAAGALAAVASWLMGHI